MSGSMTAREYRPSSKPPTPQLAHLEQLPREQPLSGSQTERGPRIERGAFARRTMEEAGINYLKGSRVGSAVGYMNVAGSILAIPHGRRTKAPTKDKPRFNAVSEQAARFREMPYCYASMDRKPLMPYHPNAFRSRLAIEDCPVPYKNASTIDFNDGIHTCRKRRFVTTNSVHFGGEPCDPRTNQGVISEEVRFRRFMQDL
eukprot:TRINITY_DN63915_c0_g1_i1.p1 TRINITY_DN63915_c0_g1~~TRINITY_DN63915_c0_g1_i1.p1  ORF type:complete len:235 (-),score=26.30 TRINITY_DN63915_c0_g1_i1:381-983(-)